MTDQQMSSLLSQYLTSQDVCQDISCLMSGTRKTIDWSREDHSSELCYQSSKDEFLMPSKIGTFYFNNAQQYESRQMTHVVQQQGFRTKNNN